ncbi:hypothetical protein [Jiangella anatolica]|nr:hypothetical protein [Jiangella anatolica]
MSIYTPTTATVRASYGDYVAQLGSISYKEAQAGFDRWLESVLDDPGRARARLSELKAA